MFRNNIIMRMLQFWSATVPSWGRSRWSNIPRGQWAWRSASCHRARSSANGCRYGGSGCRWCRWRGRVTRGILPSVPTRRALIKPINFLHIDGAHNLSRAQIHFLRGLGYDSGQFIVLGEVVPTVVHDAAVVVGHVEVVGAVHLELVLRAGLEVAPDDGDELVAVRATLLVEEAQRVHDFMLWLAEVRQTARHQVDHLLAAGPGHVRTAPESERNHVSHCNIIQCFMSGPKLLCNQLNL